MWSAVPDRLEQPVRESERQDVLCRFLPEEVVDPVDLVLAEGLVQRCVQRSCRGEVGAERLLHDDPGPVDQAGFGQGGDDDPCRCRRHAQVVQTPGFAAECGLGLGHCLRQTRGTEGLWDVLELHRERIPLRIAEVSTGELVDGPAGERTEAVGVERVEGRADDAALAHQTGEEQVQQAREQFASGQVAGRAEQHDHVWLHRRHQRRRDVARIGVGGDVLGHRRTLRSSRLRVCDVRARRCSSVLVSGRRCSSAVA